jgi:1,4-dihydroxy-2-naphthoate octaprenyltransferase
MNTSSSSFLRKVFKVSHPWCLLLGVLLYALGGGVAHFLGIAINWTVYWVGQAFISTLQLSSFYLKAYYDQLESRQILQADKSDDEFSEPDFQILPVAFAALTAAASLMVLLLFLKVMNGSVLIILGVAFLLFFFYAVPPLRLVNSGYGELVDAFIYANLIPALAFLFLAGEIHRILAMLTFPLTALYLAMAIVLTLPNFAKDILLNRRTLVTSITWQRGMNLHNVLILTAYLILGIASILGLAWRLTWPGLLTIPLGMYQIWQILQIAGGAKPNWRILTYTAIGTFVLTAYFLTLTLWIG